MLKLFTSLALGFCLALVSRAAINYSQLSDQKAYLTQLCSVAEPSLQTGSRREVVEFLTAAIKGRYPDRSIRVVLSEAAGTVVMSGLNAELDSQFDCPVVGRVGVTLGYRYSSLPLWDMTLAVATLLASLGIYVLIEGLAHAKVVVERYAIEAFESVLAKKLDVALPRVRADGPLARLFDLDSPMLAEVNSRVAGLQATISHQTAALAEGEKNAAVASMTSMLAHDVRKPFSILRMGLGMLGKAKDPAAVKRILADLVPEIDKAVSSVDGLIADVLEVGSPSTQLFQEPASPESLIEAALGEAFRIYPKADISISYDLRHTHMANVHIQKVGRVFSNIVGNALQAMGYQGDIWFKTREGDGKITFCLGNAGSVIAQESLSKLFEAFFTSGKRGGTGLGLAIAQKVVTAHGGRIWCESSKTLEHPDGKVEFFFTLPVAEGHASKKTAALPRCSSDITRTIAAMAADAEVREGSVDKGELTLEADIIAEAENLGRPLKVLVVEPMSQGAAAAEFPTAKPEIAVVDDNPFILDAWEDVLKTDAVLHTFASLEDLTERLEADPALADRLLAAITDMHLDGSAGDGLDVGRLLKKWRPGLPVLLSSDGTFARDELAGAIDRVISKEPVALRSLGLA